MIVKKVPIAILLSAMTSTILILLQLLRWSLTEVVTPFIEPVIEALIWALFFVSLIWGIIYLVRKKRRMGIRTAIPILVNVCAIIIVISVPFNSILININFKSNYFERQKVISLIESDKLSINHSSGNSLTILPSKFKDLSSGGEIAIERKGNEINVFFYTYRGVLNNFSGFVYTTGNSILKQGLLDQDFKKFRKIEEHWFWISSN